MNLIKPDEVGVHIQKEDCWKLFGIGLLNDPARFSEPKPPMLYLVPDDSWAALILRVDPLARKILEPRRSFLGASLLFIIITTVFATIRPTVRLSSFEYEVDDDKNDDFYNYVDDYNIEDDVLIAEMQYREIEIAAELRAWQICYFFAICLLIASTAAISLLMERRNQSYDEKIRDACAEIGTRFQSAGVTIEYRTHHLESHFIRFLAQERAIIFHTSDEAQTAYIPAELPNDSTIFRQLREIQNDRPFLDKNVSSTSGSLLGMSYVNYTSDEDSGESSEKK